MSLSPEVQVIINSGVVGVICFLLITRIEKKLDELIKAVNTLVSAINIAGAHA